MNDATTTSAAGLVGRLTWFFFGPMLLLLITFAIVSKGGGWLTGVDVAYFVILGLMIVGRWVEFRSGQAQTATGEVATVRHLHRYVVGAVFGGLAVWVFANFLGNHWLAR